MGSFIGYARVSTAEQNLDLQRRALHKVGCERIYEDLGQSGAIRNREGLQSLLTVLEPGDTLVIWRLDRLARSLTHLLDVVTDLQGRDVALSSVCESINTSSASGILFLHIMGALAEFERTLISERTKAGMAAARARGQSLGRPTSPLPAQFAETVAAARQNKVTVSAAARSLGMSRSTFYRALKSADADQGCQAA